MKTPQLLLVDDEPNILLLFKAFLQDAGYAVQTVNNAFDGLTALESQDFDVLVTDLKMPGASGLDLIGQARQLNPACAVIVISGNATVETVIEALRIDVDDFLLKPIAREVMIQTIGRAMLKRRMRTNALTNHSAELDIGALKINTAARTAHWHGQALDLTPTEYCLLLTLAQHAGQSVPPSTLIRRCRGYSASDEEARQLLKPHIANLRQKLELDGRFPRVLVNHRGVGFVINVEIPTPQNL